ncbi:MerR family transcriptional regulator [Enterococcus caccae]|nr:MerR family transcriptional regulator [Enterococcus caccae]OJG27330.1 hypothetical protein RU98_GL002782 [Enterococcus caccae]
MGQLAELMAISKHQIRYNEDKGLLAPAFIDSNGYHKYGVDQVYQLANILLMRSLGISTAQIAQFMENQDNVWAEKTLKETLKATEEKIQQFVFAKEKIEAILPEIDQKEEAYVSLPERRLKKIYSYPVTESLNIVAFFKTFKKNQQMLFESLYYLVEDHQINIYIEDQLSKDNVLNAGDYLVRRVWIEDEAELSEAVDRFKKENQSPFLNVSEVIIKEAAYSSILMNNKLLYELQCLILMRGAY